MALLQFTAELRLTRRDDPLALVAVVLRWILDGVADEVHVAKPAQMRRCSDRLESGCADPVEAEFEPGQLSCVRRLRQDGDRRVVDAAARQVER